MPGLFAFLPRLDLPPAHAEFSNGFSGTEKGWTAYASGVIGLASPLDRDGWRLKFGGHYARFGYERREGHICEKNESWEVQSNTTIRDVCQQITDPESGGVSQETEAYLESHGYEVVDQNLARVSTHQIDRIHLGAAPGYKLTLGALVLKTYLGLAYRSESVLPGDPSRTAPEESWGAEAIIESWLTLGERSWLSADGSYFTGGDNYSAEIRLGHRPLDWLSAGPELAAHGDPDDFSGRAGAFLRFHRGQAETTLSGGFSGTYRDDPAIYGAANFYMRF